MATHSPRTTVGIAIREPLGRADLPGLYARVCQLLEANAGGVILCDVAGVRADAVAVEALARLQLGARRHRCEFRLLDVSDPLREVVEFMGLGDVLPERRG
jgi:ABC-type transporter Mla MlaB component